MKQLVHFFKLAWSVSPAYILVMLFNSAISGGKLILNVILPKLLIDELTGHKDIKMIIIFGGLIVLNNCLMKLIENTLSRYLDVKKEYLSNMMVEIMGEKIMNLEYSYLEDPYYLDLKERAIFAITNQNAIESTITEASQCLTQAVTLIGLVAIMATLGPVLIVAIVLGTALMLLCYSIMMKEMQNAMQSIIPINRRFGYYFNLTMEAKAQKEIRLYGMEPMITDTVKKDNELTCDMMGSAFGKMGVGIGMMAIVSEAVSVFSYIYVGIRTLSDKFGRQLSLGDLTMYVTSAINFSTSIEKFGEQIVGLLQMMGFLEPYMEFMTLEEETKEYGKEMFSGDIETVEFRDVTFTYPKAEKPILKNITFEIHKGEKISIVGLNGAGKSTLVKLICRMYKADSGQILVNGKNIYDYDYNSYMKAISAVFQDYKLFNFSIEENISCQGDNLKGSDAVEKSEKVSHLIEEVGMKEKVDSLPLGMKSRFGKDYDEDGIEMSGGQGQKIAIARALYKPASMVILDEPASALDPIAEAEIYEKFNSLVEDKTAIYISHRMSSSVFCDKILIIDGGTVSDFDTHANLMKKTDSLYYKLFMAQAENYKLAKI